MPEAGRKEVENLDIFTPRGGEKFRSRGRNNEKSLVQVTAKRNWAHLECSLKISNALASWSQVLRVIKRDPLEEAGSSVKLPGGL